MSFHIQEGIPEVHGKELTASDITRKEKLLRDSLSNLSIFDRRCFSVQATEINRP